MVPRSWMSIRFAAVALALLLIAHAAVGPSADSSAAQSETPLAYVSPYEVEVVVNNDGSLDVVEKIWVHSARGVLRSGDRWIPTGATDGISNVRLLPSSPNSSYRWQQVDFPQLEERLTQRYPELPSMSPDSLGLFSVREIPGDPDRMAVDFLFPYPVEKGNFFVLVLAYHVAGGLRSYPDAEPPMQQLWWTAIGAEYAATVPVHSGSVTVQLPGVVDPMDVIAAHNGVRDDARDLMQGADGRTFAWFFDRTLSDAGFDVRLEFPWVATEANVPAWQQEMEQDARLEQWIHLTLLALGIGGASVGGVALGMWWFTRGRDPVTGLIAEELTEPPGALKPWLAGALLDESVDPRDIVAMLLDFQSRGVVSISSHTFSNGAVQHWNTERTLTLLDPPRQPTIAETLLLEAAFGSTVVKGAETTLSTAGHGIVAALPRIRDALYDDLVTQGLMVASPARTRRRWRIAGVVVGISGGVIGLGGVVQAEPLSLVPTVAFVGLGAAMIGVAKAMPRKTVYGAEQAALWRAYQRYLRTSLPRADDPERLHRYLPYTIALGTDLVWVNDVLAGGQRDSVGWRDRLEEFFAGSSVLDGDWGGQTSHSEWAPPPYLGTPSGGEIGMPLPGAGGLGRMSKGTAKGLGTASAEGFGLLDGLALLLEIGSIFLGGGKGGGGGGGSFR